MNLLRSPAFHLPSSTSVLEFEEVSVGEVRHEGKDIDAEADEKG
jgi:hypothetical protein